MAGHPVIKEAGTVAGEDKTFADLIQAGTLIGIQEVSIVSFAVVLRSAVPDRKEIETGPTQRHRDTHGIPRTKKIMDCDIWPFFPNILKISFSYSSE